MSETTKSYLPVPEFHDNRSHSFKNTSEDNLTNRTNCPPKIYRRSYHQHDTSFNKNASSQNSSFVANTVSFLENSSTLSLSIPLSKNYRPDLPDTYFVQCFDVISLLGEGSFSKVYKVRSRDDNRLYAIKRSKQPYKSEKYREERLEEVRRFEQLSKHDHCIRLYNAWEQHDILYMQLELCQNSLDTFVRQEKHLSEAMIWNILLDLLLAIKALHDLNLIHLDIKLENILVNEDNECKLGDFGLVVDLNKPNLHQSCEGDSRYIAPELMQSKFTKAADIFSFGITILELACNLILPRNGDLWTELRSGIFPPFFYLISKELQEIIRITMNPIYEDRPTVDQLLKMPQIQTRLIKRNKYATIKKITSKYPKIIYRFIWEKICSFRNKIYALVSLLFAPLRFRIIKPLPTTPKNSSSILYNNNSARLNNYLPPAVDSLALLEDSEIECSPVKNPMPNNLSGIVNSTPLSHCVGIRSLKSRRNHQNSISMELDLDDVYGSVFNSSNSYSPNKSYDPMCAMSPKRKKLFSKTDEEESD